MSRWPRSKYSKIAKVLDGANLLNISECLSEALRGRRILLLVEKNGQVTRWIQSDVSLLFGDALYLGARTFRLLREDFLNYNS
jgi:hypothetical protein